MQLQFTNKPDCATPKYNAEPLLKRCVTVLQQLFRVDRDRANQSRAHSQHAISEHRHLEVAASARACVCACACVREGGGVNGNLVRCGSKAKPLFDLKHSENMRQAGG